MKKRMFVWVALLVITLTACAQGESQQIQSGTVVMTTDAIQVATEETKCEDTESVVIETEPLQTETMEIAVETEGKTAEETTESYGPLVLASKENMENGHISYYWYNEQGLLASEKGEEYYYYDNGSLKKRIRYQGDEISCIYEYDEHGNEVTILEYENGEPSERIEITNHYITFQGKQVLKKSISESDGMETIREYTYHDDGSIWVDQIVNLNGERYDHRAAKFTKDGTLVSSIYDFVQGDDQLGTEKRIVTLGQQNYPIKEVYESEMPGIRRIVSTTEYVNFFDQEGRITKTEEYGYSKVEYLQEGITQEVPRTLNCVMEYTYDEQGRMVRKWTTDAETGYVYDEHIWEYDENGFQVYFKGNEITPPIDVFFSWGIISSYGVEESYTYLPLSEVLYEKAE